MPLDEARRLLAGRPLPRSRRRHPDYPTGDTLDALAVLVGAYEALGEPPGRWWTSYVTVAGLVVGDAGFHGPPDPGRAVEIGYQVVPAWRGRGVGRAACALLVEQAWAGGAERVVAETGPANAASRRVLAACGFGVDVDGRHVLARPGAAS